MDIFKVLLICVMLSKNLIQVTCFVDPLTLGVIGAAASGIYMLFSTGNDGKTNINKISKYVCQRIGYCEGCEDYWIPGNIQGLEFDLRASIFGQSLAVDVVLGALRHHLERNKEPERALMLSFHGPPGTGKNFISQKILKNMFRNGVKTQYVHFFRGSIDFPSKSNVDQYKREIITSVQSNVLECKRSIFVFDEVEKMPGGILDVLSAFTKAGRHGDYDYRRVIFILLSNIGNDFLISEALQNYKRGEQREDMNLNYVQKMLANSAYNEEGGLRRAGIIRNFGVTYFVPFLPLERHHLVQCLEKHVAKMGQEMSRELEEQVFEELTFGPAPHKLFSVSGCKGVAEKARMLIEREQMKQRRKQRM